MVRQAVLQSGEGKTDISLQVRGHHRLIFSCIFVQQDLQRLGGLPHLAKTQGTRRARKRMGQAAQIIQGLRGIDSGDNRRPALLDFLYFAR